MGLFPEFCLLSPGLLAYSYSDITFSFLCGARGSLHICQNRFPNFVFLFAITVINFGLLFFNINLKTGLGVCSCNPNTWEDHKFKASLGYMEDGVLLSSRARALHVQHCKGKWKGTQNNN
jgi:hypothetical protein